MKSIKSVVLLALMTAGSVNAQTSTKEKPTIIFVHGIWADGSSFKSQVEALQVKGYQVMSVQNPVTSLADDVAATQRAIDQVKGKVILVGHSWGGMVISQAGNDPKVAGLVYLAAYAPEARESIITLSANAPGTQLPKHLAPTGGFVYISQQGVKPCLQMTLQQNNRLSFLQRKHRPLILYSMINQANLRGKINQAGTW